MRFSDKLSGTAERRNDLANCSSVIQNVSHNVCKVRFVPESNDL